MPGKTTKTKKKKTMNVQVNCDQWPGFTDQELQDLICNHFRGVKTKKGRGKGKAKGQQQAHLYIGLGKNPMSFVVTLCPTYPCSG